MSEQDAHLVDALNEHSDRPIAVGIRGGTERKNRREQHRIASLLEAKPPLLLRLSLAPAGGSKDLSLKDAPWRKPIKPIKIGKAA